MILLAIFWTLISYVGYSSWTQVWQTIDDQTGTVTLTAALNPAYWSDAGGCATNCLGDFWSTVGNVQEIGLAFGGGEFFDVGLAMWAGGTNLFHLKNVSAVTPPQNKPKEAYLSN